MNLQALAAEVSIAALRCRCGSPDVVVIDPGHPAQIEPVTGITLSRGRPVTGRCLACWAGPRDARPNDRRGCYSCAATAADGAVFRAKCKPIGKPDLCVDCTWPVGARLGGPVFAPATYAAASRRRRRSAQMDIEDAARDAGA